MRFVRLLAIAAASLALAACEPLSTIPPDHAPASSWPTWLTPPGTDDRARVLLPDEYDAHERWPVVLFLHGTGRTAEDIGNANTRVLVEGLARAGYITVVPDLGGKVPWGADEQIDELVAAYAQVRVTFNTGPLFTVAASAGNLPALIAIADGRLPDVVGHYGLYPVTNLAHQYEANAEHAGLIEATYEFDDAAEYAEATAGHDPMLLPPNRFDGVAMRFSASPDDEAVDAHANAVGLTERLAAARGEASVMIGHGPHGSPSTTDLEDVLSFFDRSLAAHLRPAS